MSCSKMALISSMVDLVVSAELLNIKSELCQQFDGGKKKNATC